MWKLDVEQEMEDPSRIYLYPNAIEIVSSHLKKASCQSFKVYLMLPFLTEGAYGKLRCGKKKTNFYLVTRSLTQRPPSTPGNSDTENIFAILKARGTLPQTQHMFLLQGAPSWVGQA